MITKIINKMKVLLVVCLLASISCINIINVGICLIGNGKFISIVGDAISSIKEKNYEKLLKIILSNCNELKDMVFNCLKDRNDNKLDKSITTQPQVMIRCPHECCIPHVTTCLNCKCY